jgi:hypothetical protein
VPRAQAIRRLRIHEERVFGETTTSGLKYAPLQLRRRVHPVSLFRLFGVWNLQAIQCKEETDGFFNPYYGEEMPAGAGQAEA